MVYERLFLFEITSSPVVGPNISHNILGWKVSGIFPPSVISDQRRMLEIAFQCEVSVMVFLLLLVSEVVTATSDYCQWTERHTMCGYQVSRDYQRGDSEGTAGSRAGLWD